MYGFVTDSPLFDNPGGFNRALTNEENLRLRASAQQAMEAGRPMTMAEMYGKPQQLFRQLSGFGEEPSSSGNWSFGQVAAVAIAGTLACLGPLYLTERLVHGEDWKNKDTFIGMDARLELLLMSAIIGPTTLLGWKLIEPLVRKIIPKSIILVK